MTKWLYGLWLDDERNPSKDFLNRVENCYIAKTFEDAIFYLANFKEDESYEDLYIDFDHDLGREKTGYDFAKWLLEHEIKIGGFGIHSMNPVGAKNIYELLTHYDYEYWPPSFIDGRWRNR